MSQIHFIYSIFLWNKMVLKLFFNFWDVLHQNWWRLLSGGSSPNGIKGHIFTRQSLLRGDPSKNTMKVFCLLVVVGIACAAPERGKSNQYNICIWKKSSLKTTIYFAEYVNLEVFIWLANTILCVQKMFN